MVKSFSTVSLYSLTLVWKGKLFSLASSGSIAKLNNTPVGISIQIFNHIYGSLGKVNLPHTIIYILSTYCAKAV